MFDAVCLFVLCSVAGYGVLTCPNAQPTDQGAYSCEAINIKGSVFVVPDTIVTVIGVGDSICIPPQFNALATTPRDCLSCFCFGASTDCFSTDRYVSQVCRYVSQVCRVAGLSIRVAGVSLMSALQRRMRKNSDIICVTSHYCISVGLISYEVMR